MNACDCANCCGVACPACDYADENDGARDADAHASDLAEAAEWRAAHADYLLDSTEVTP